MKYCPNCGTEYLDTIDACSDCSEKLIGAAEWEKITAKEKEQREDLRNIELVPACTVGGRIEAQALLAVLEQEGIPALLRSFEDTAYAGLFTGSKGWGQIWTAKRRLDEAKQLIDDVRASDSPDLEGDDS